MTVGRLAIVYWVILAAACGRADDARTYQLTGQVLAVNQQTKQILVKHEDIPGFMPAMTMPYSVSDPALLKDRAAGDLVTATLKVATDGAFLTAITKTGSAPVPDDAPTAIPVAAGVHMLQTGDTAADATLSDQDGKPLTLADLKGSAVAVTFIYTRCPLPQYCPLMDRRFAETQSLIKADAALRGKVQLLTVSFDPKFDRAGILREHARKLGADPAMWRFATADESIVDRFAVQFGVNVIREKDGSITHNLRTAVIAPDGRVTALLDDNAWSAEELARALRDAVH